MKPVIDPYAVLKLSLDANDAQIKQAFHQAMQATHDPATITHAYHMIRTQEARAEYQWNNLCSYFCAPLFSDNQNFDLEALIREVAFQSEWELGDDRCPTKE